MKSVYQTTNFQEDCYQEDCHQNNLSLVCLEFYKHDCLNIHLPGHFKPQKLT